jgi:Glycosyltransferase family 87
MLSDETLQTTFGLRRRTTRYWGDLIRAVTATLACLMVAAMAVIYTGTLEGTVTLRNLQDFGMFDRSARQLRAGEPLYEPLTLEAGQVVERPLNLNPPHFHFLLLPLTSLAPERAFAVWMVSSGIALAWSIVLIQRTLNLGIWATAALVTAVVVSPAMHSTMMTGQIGLALLVPYMFAWLRERSGHDTRAALWLGFCASIKPFFLLFALDFIVRRRWRAAGIMMATVGVIFSAGVLAVGADSYAEWIRQLAGVSWAEHYMNASLLGTIERTFSSTPWGLHPLIDAPGIVWPLWAGGAALVGLATLATVRGATGADRRFLIVSSAMLLISPLGWVYYLWFVMPPLTAILADAARMPVRQRLFVALGTLALFVPPPFPWRTFIDGIRTATLGSIYMWGLLCLFLASILRTGSEKGEVSSPRSAVPGVREEPLVRTVVYGRPKTGDRRPL